MDHDESTEVHDENEVRRFSCESIFDAEDCDAAESVQLTGESASQSTSSPTPPSFSNISGISANYHSCTIYYTDDETYQHDIVANDGSAEGHVDESNSWTGYKIVGDNLDKNIKPRYKRIDHQTQSLHFFHHFAVKDRIDLSSVSDDPSPYIDVPVSDLPIDALLPSVPDHQTLMHNFAILVSRVLVAELSYFQTTFDDVVVPHITHQYYNDMSKKSETVNLVYLYSAAITCVYIM